VSANEFFSALALLYLLGPIQRLLIMGKSKKGKGGKLGAPDHFSGFKLDFLIARAGLYQQSLDSNSPAAFYDKVTLDFIVKYGEEQPFNKPLDEDAPDPEIFDAGDDEDDPRHSPSKEEAAESAALFTKLRTVSCKQSNTPRLFLIYFSETRTVVQAEIQVS